MSGVDLGELAGDPYDEYFDGLTGAERNWELKGQARPKPVTQQPIRGPETETQPKHHWATQVAGYVILISGEVVILLGQAIVIFGKGLQKWGQYWTV